MIEVDGKTLVLMLVFSSQISSFAIQNLFGLLEVHGRHQLVCCFSLVASLSLCLHFLNFLQTRMHWGLQVYRVIDGQAGQQRFGNLNFPHLPHLIFLPTLVDLLNHHHLEHTRLGLFLKLHAGFMTYLIFLREYVLHSS